MRVRPADGRQRGRRIAPAALSSLLILGGCRLDVLDPAGYVGIADKTILIDSVAIMLAIVVPTVAATLGFAWWFRASNTRATHRPDFVYSGRIELIVWGIPLLVITLLGGVAWIGAHRLDPALPAPSGAKPLEVEVVSLDWKWLFLYPEQHVASLNRLVVPAGVPVHFRLTSASVMNAFFVPRLGSMIYTMNGMATQLTLQADQPGSYRGLSSHYSGDGFSGMHFSVDALPQDQFEAWVADTQASGPTLDATAYTKLAQQSLDVAPATYRDADPALFDEIVMQKLPPGPGPADGPAPRAH
jgi:cytochrome o ubiquinol oxidase subunit 2